MLKKMGNILAVVVLLLSGLTTAEASVRNNEIIVHTESHADALVGIPHAFSASASLSDGMPLHDASYRYNFGDGAVGDGANTEHVYRFPGDYIATLDVFWNGKTESVRINVSVTPPEVAIAGTAFGSDGYIELKNKSEHELDISNWRLVNGTKEFIFPLHTYLPADRTLVLPNQNTGLLFSRAVNKLTLTHSDGKAVFVSTLSTAHAEEKPPLSATQVSKASPESKAEGVVLGTTTNKAGNEAAVGRVLWKQGGVSPQFLRFSLSLQWLFVILAMMAIVVAVYIIVRSHVDQATQADEYAIIEDIIEGHDDLT